MDNIKNFMLNGKKVKLNHFLKVKDKPKYKIILISNY